MNIYARFNVKAAFLMNLCWIIAICIFSSREMLIVLTELMNEPSLVLNNREFKNLNHKTIFNGFHCCSKAMFCSSFLQIGVNFT